MAEKETEVDIERKRICDIIRERYRIKEEQQKEKYAKQKPEAKKRK